MNILKQLDKLVIRSFIGPYLVSFFVAEFVLVLQFLWKYIDEFIGRGVSLWTISQMIFYYGITIIPLAVPISILISSVMVYGAMAERYELTAFKSAGVSLNRIIRPGLVIAILTAIFSLFSSNFLKPKANLEFFQTFDNVRRAKPTLTIEEGIFNYDFKGFAIRVAQKDQDGQGIKNVLVYDQTERGKLSMTSAESGEMFISEDGRIFNLILNNGYQYSELEERNSSPTSSKQQFVRVKFESWKRQFDMGEFDFSFSNANLGRRKHDLYNAMQIVAAMDSIDVQMVESLDKSDVNFNFLFPPIGEDADTLKANPNPNTMLRVKDGADEEMQEIREPESSKKYYDSRINFRQDTISLDTVETFIATIRKEALKNILFRTKSNAQAEREKFRALNSSLDTSQFSRNRFELRLHQQFCWAAICIVFMLIGAPLGSIVRKGGFGYPLLISIVFFIVFIFTSILGEKLMISGNLNPIIAAWLPFAVLVPFAIYFMSKAINDSRLELKFNFLSWFKRKSE